MSKYNIGIPGPWIKFRSDEVEKQLKEIETILTAQNQVFYQPFGPVVNPVQKHDKEPELPPNFAELVQKQVTVLLFALSTNRFELAIKICERLNSTEFFSWDCSYFGLIPRGGFKGIIEQLEYMIHSLHRYAGVGDPYLRKFLELLSEKDLWEVTL